MSEYEIQVGSLEELALQRRERLKNLKRKAQALHNAGPDAPQPIESTKINLPRPTELLKVQDASQDKNEETAMEVEEVQSNDVVTIMTKDMEAMKHPLVIDEIDIQNLAPRKPDWDLKRGKMAKRQTKQIFKKHN